MFPLRSSKEIFRVTWWSKGIFALLLVDFDVPSDAQAKSHARSPRKSWHSTALRKPWARMPHSTRKSPRGRYINRPIWAGGTRKLQRIWKTPKRNMLDYSFLDWLTLNSRLYHTDRHGSRELPTVQILRRALTYSSRNVLCAVRARSMTGSKKRSKSPKCRLDVINLGVCFSACACITPNAHSVTSAVASVLPSWSTTCRSIPVENQDILADDEDDPPLSRLHTPRVVPCLREHPTHYRSLSLMH